MNINPTQNSQHVGRPYNPLQREEGEARQHYEEVSRRGSASAPTDSRSHTEMYNPGKSPRPESGNRSENNADAARLRDVQERNVTEERGREEDLQTRREEEERLREEFARARQEERTLRSREEEQKNRVEDYRQAQERRNTDEYLLSAEI